MPSLSAYQGLAFDDANAIAVWLLAHRFRHGTYDRAASLLGFTVEPYHLDSYPDDMWFANHASSHQFLQQFMSPDNTVDMTVLTNYSWDTQANFDTWMHMHTLIHQLLDQHFGIFS
jgi:hypothetical protein